MFDHLTSRHRSIVRVLAALLGVNVAIAVAKITAGFAAGSLTVLADGLHSVLDGATNIIGLVAIVLAARPADADHPYGHEKFENVASLLIAGLLVLVGMRVFEAAVTSLWVNLMAGGAVNVAREIHWPAAGAVVVAAMASLAMARYERRRGEELSSTILTADAAHTRTDVAVSFLGLASLLIAPFVWWVDPLLAVCVLGYLANAAWGIVKENLPAFTDRQALEPEEVSGVVRAVDGVIDCGDIRSHGNAVNIHLDLNVTVDGSITAVEVEQIETEVRERLVDAFPAVSLVAIHHRTITGEDTDSPASRPPDNP